MRAVAVVLSLILFAPHYAFADAKQAKAFYDAATSAYALGHYDDAADNYEKAFQQKQDSALLFDAAQARRRGGNVARALELYNNYLHLYPSAKNRDDVEHIIAQLDAEKQAQRERDAKQAEMPAVAAPTAIVEVAAPPPRKPIYKKGWFWGVVVGSVVVVGVALGVGLSFGLPPKAPRPSLGPASGN